MKRADRWKKFYDDAETRSRKHAPAFIQEVVVGLWSIQTLTYPRVPQHGWLYRLFNDPPSATDFEPFYNGWPGDHRGWMRFESKESARDFYKFATDRMSWEDYQNAPAPPLSNVRINMDEHGDFVAA